MKQKHWKILSLLMLLMAIGFSVTAFMGHSEAVVVAILSAGATFVTYGAAKRVK